MSLVHSEHPTPKPNTKKYSVNNEGLIKAAENIGKIGEAGMPGK